MFVWIKIYYMYTYRYFIANVLLSTLRRFASPSAEVQKPITPLYQHEYE